MTDNHRLGRLLIKDASFGKLKYSFNLTESTGEFDIRATLEMTISSDGNNVQNLSAEEYRTRIREVFNYLHVQYGILADYESVRLRRLEINATFALNEPYERYRYPILMMMRNVPPKRFSSDKNEVVKYATWAASDMAAQTDRLETALVKNSSIELKIYHKSKWLRDQGFESDDGRDLMRVEYTLKDARLLERYFADNMVSSLSDDQIRTMFQDYFKRDVIERFKSWHDENIRQLADMIEKHRKTEVHWVGYFLRECRQYAEIHGLPILFSLEDVKEAMRLLEPCGGKNLANKYKRFLRQAFYEKDLSGNTRRMKEIFGKIMRM